MSGKIEVDPEELEKLVERKVEERLKERLEQETVENSKNSEDGISRRGFLKKLGAGAMGLGAVSFSSVSALTLSKNSIRNNGQSISSGGLFDLNSYLSRSGGNLSGPLTLGGDLKANDGELIWDESNSFVPASVLEQSGIDHDNLSSISADDHHPEVSAGTNISVDSSNTVGVSPQGHTSV